MVTAARFPVLLRPLQRRILPMLDQILMLFLKIKEDVKGQRYNLEYNQIAYMFVYITFVLYSILYPRILNKVSYKLNSIPSV